MELDIINFGVQEFHFFSKHFDVMEANLKICIHYTIIEYLMNLEIGFDFRLISICIMHLDNDKSRSELRSQEFILSSQFYNAVMKRVARPQSVS